MPRNKLQSEVKQAAQDMRAADAQVALAKAALRQAREERKAARQAWRDAYDAAELAERQ